MKVEALPGFESLDPRSWDDLVARSGGASVFLTWAWQTEWARAFLDGRPLRILKAADDAGTLMGLLPLYEDGPGLWRIVGGVDVSDYLDLIAIAGMEPQVWAAVVDHRADEESIWELRGLRPQSPTLALLPTLAVARGLEATAEVEERCPVLALPGTWEEYLGRLSGKDRHELRRKMRRLEAELPGVQARAQGPGEGWEPAMTEFLRLHRLSRQGKARFMDEPMERFFRSALRALVESGWARLWFLDHAGASLASFLCLEYGATVGLYNSGFDPERARLAPGIVLLAHVIRDAIERRIPVFDFLRGEEPYKYGFGPVAEDLFRIRLAPRSASSGG